MESTRGGAPKQPEPQKRQARQSGAYGFSRSEIGALIFVALLILAVGSVRWWQRQDRSAPPWAIENVLIESAEPSRGRSGDSAAENRSRGTPGTHVPSAATIDLNTAVVDELSRLPGIGPVLAGRIVTERKRGGPFRDLLDLQRVQGIGASKAAALGGWVTFSSPSQPDSMGAQ